MENQLFKIIVCAARAILLLPALLTSGLSLSAQALTDSLQLDEVTVSAYLGDKPISRFPASVSMIDRSTLQLQNDQSFTAAMNTAPGVHMEERSPGSYRLSMRGSLLRSPFGIRNVKVYVDEFALTDGGGNTYLNLLDASLANRLEIIKGPDGSIFGANSGGVVRLNMFDLSDSSSAGGGIAAGSFASFHEYAKADYSSKKNVFFAGAGLLNSDGYRDNTTLSRDYGQVGNKWSYSKKGDLKFFLFYSRLGYLTPGGLTLSQYNDNPRSARPSTPAIPGAIEQKTGVSNSTLFGGLTNRFAFQERTALTVSVFGSSTDFRNPFLTNFETRMEKNAGFRAWLETGSAKSHHLVWTYDIGAEGQKIFSDISVNGNRNGEKDTLQSRSRFEAAQGFIFTRLNFDLDNRVQIEFSVSDNFNQYIYTNISTGDPEIHHAFEPQLMPRIAASWLIFPSVAWRSSLSRGYSPPTLAEVLPSGNIFNPALQPEQGYNYETGLRLHDGRQIFWWDVSVFYYRLHNAIVRRTDVGGNEFFINAGGTTQPGLESQLIMNIFRRNHAGIFHSVKLSNSYTYSAFRFTGYQAGSADYSGNKLTGVPDHTLVSGLLIGFPGSFTFYFQHSYISRLPLNDAGTAYADEYHIFQARLSWQKHFGRNLDFEIYCGVGNLFNEKYSPGSDLNAAGGRYYNAALPRNYFLGLALR